MFDEITFKKAAKSAESLYRENGLDKNMRGEDAFTDAGIKVAWCVYEGVTKARQKYKENFLGLIAGGIETDTDPEKQGASIEKYVRENFGTMDENTRDFYGTGVLSSANWSMLVNDAWLLAGVHSGVEFFLASRRTERNIWDANNKRLRVFGRELIGMTSFGFTFKDSQWPQLGEVAVRTGKAQTPDFLTYQKEVMARQGKWRDLLAPPSAQPVITALTPAKGPAAGKTKVTITGKNMARVIKVGFENTVVPATDNTATSVQTTTPRHGAGPVNVTLFNDDGVASEPRLKAFTYI
ncbi:IPT/TIG domain-containing protein [Streptomyces sp. NPDC087212]|uniref:IPT/TIG domain-containing protein n=1 Tax=Streptomyces sp. NPDC087212 TaxID=3365766 RepID=UPI003810AA12